MSKYTKTLESLHFLARYAFNRAGKVINKKLGTQDSRAKSWERGLEALCGDLKKIRGLAEGKRVPKIGVFGAPKRGKSTLLNVMLGGDYLPTGVAPATHCAIEMKPVNRNSYTVIVTDDDGKIERETFQNLTSVKNMLEKFNNSEKVSEIAVEGPFKSPFGEKLIFIDTPGAESDFESTADENSESDSRLSLDTKRALLMLNDVDIVIFCMRSQFIEEAQDAQFYKDHLRQYHPINVINCRDESNGVDDKALLNIATDTYGFYIDETNTVAVSAREAQESGYDLGNGNMPALKKLIEGRISVIDDVVKDRLEIYFSDYHWFIQDALKKGVSLLPEKIYVEKLSSGVDDIQSIKNILESEPYSHL
jgi:GTPase Era involved in 16S rRNA processing